VTGNYVRQFASSATYKMGVKLPDVVKVIEQFSPPKLAGSWDNVGLLVDPMDDLPVKKVMVTNDLTEAVMNECIKEGANLILSYHPPIFRPLKRLTAQNWKERIVVNCLVNRIAVYSPHTSLDAVKGGVNDWLIKPYGDGDVKPLEETEPGSSIGPGRLLTLENSLSLEDVLQRTKSHLDLDHVRLALKAGTDKVEDVKAIKTIAVCAGSGCSVLVNAKGADLWITGEMSHHEVLDAVHLGTNVILADHSNTERGFLKEYAQQLSSSLPDVDIVVSSVDTDPLQVV